MSPYTSGGGARFPPQSPRAAQRLSPRSGSGACAFLLLFFLLGERSLRPGWGKA